MTSQEVARILMRKKNLFYNLYANVLYAFEYLEFPYPLQNPESIPNPKYMQFKEFTTELIQKQDYDNLLENPFQNSRFHEARLVKSFMEAVPDLLNFQIPEEEEEEEEEEENYFMLIYNEFTQTRNRHSFIELCFAIFLLVYIYPWQEGNNEKYGKRLHELNLKFQSYIVPKYEDDSSTNDEILICIAEFMKDFLDDPDIVFSKKIEYEFSASTKSFIRCNFLMMYFFQIYDPLIMKLKHYNLLFQECPQMNGKTASIIINGFLKNAQEYKKEIDQLDTDTKEQIAERELFMKNYKICLENVANFYKYEFVELLDLKLKVLVYIAHNNICNLCDSDLKKKPKNI